MSSVRLSGSELTRHLLELCPPGSRRDRPLGGAAAGVSGGEAGAWGPGPAPGGQRLSPFLLNSKVRSFGTEDRPTDRPAPPREEVYEYIIFRGSDIKDITVCEPPKAQHTLPQDPAIVQVSAAPVLSVVGLVSEARWFPGGTRCRLARGLLSRSSSSRKGLKFCLGCWGGGSVFSRAAPALPGRCLSFGVG